MEALHNMTHSKFPTIGMGHAYRMKCAGRISAVMVSVTSFAAAATIYVAPGGSDSNPGTIDNPFRTFKKAASRMKAGDTCYLRGGIYREVLRPAGSGTEGKPLTFAAYKNEQPVLTGADPIIEWKADGNGVFSAPMDWTLGDGNQLFINGEMMCEARWPNSDTNFLFHPNRAAADKGRPDTLTCRELTGGDDTWKGAQLWCAGGSRWICWTANVISYESAAHKLLIDEKKGDWYRPGKGRLFVLRGLRRCLDAPGEWFYNAGSKKMLLIPPEGVDLKKVVVEAKRRQDAIDLSGLSYINLQGLEFRACGIRMNKKSSNNTLYKLKGRYVSHSYRHDASYKYGVQLKGSHNSVLDCDLGYSSASVLSVEGSDHRIINNYIHHGGYAGLWKGTVCLSGRRILFSHTTVRHAGRDLINTHGLMESMVQYNDVSDAGWLTYDLGMFYGHNTDYANTVFKYNLVHDNHAGHFGMGIYFDHCSHNVIVHDNIVWNVSYNPLQINNPSYCNLVFNNSCWKSGPVRSFDHDNRQDLYGCRYFNNILNKDIDLPDHVVVENNMINPDPPYANPAKQDFRLTDSSPNTLGARRPGRIGCDLDNPPKPLPVYKPPRVPWMNMVKNACFEFGTLEGWEKTGAKKAELTRGNGWGNIASPENDKTYNTGTSKFELQLGPGKDGVSQLVTGLTPDKTYHLSAWLRVSDESESVVLSVRDHGGEVVSAGSSSTEWERKTVTFTTGLSSSRAVVCIRKNTDGPGHARGDNFLLPLAP